MDNSRIVVIGCNGQLGTALQEKLDKATFVDRERLDISSYDQISGFDWSAFDIIINAAAFTAVDEAETDSGRRLAWTLNATAVGYLSDIANQYGITLVHISSDYVFDGKTVLHNEEEGLSPLGVYGQSKAAGDIAALRAKMHYLLRTSWVIGRGKNFVLTMKQLAEKGINPSVVNDQRGRLSFASDLAEAIIHLIDNRAPFGIYNFSNDGEVVSWAEIAREVYRLTGNEPSRISPISTADYYKDKPNISPRPLDSGLDLTKIKKTGLKIRNWRDALEGYLKEQ